MNKSSIFVALLMLTGMAAAQEAPGGKSLSATLEVYAFPEEGQTAEQQSKDEAACYDWAVTNSGSDPFNLQKKSKEDQQKAAEQMQAAQQATQGAGARGAVGGAAAGALIGEIASDDAGEGAAWGAAVGLIASRRQARRHSYEAQAQVVEDSVVEQQATAEQIANFKKAFSVCLEAKNYLVKY